MSAYLMLCDLLYGFSPEKLEEKGKNNRMVTLGPVKTKGDNPLWADGSTDEVSWRGSSEEL